MLSNINEDKQGTPL